VNRTARLGLLGVGWLLVALGALMFGWFIAGGSPAPIAAGLPDPGFAVSYGVVIIRLLIIVLSFLTVGALITGWWSGRSPSAIPFLALGWATAAVLQVFLVLANVLALPFSEALSPMLVLTYAGELAATRALIVTAAVAVVIAVTAFRGERPRMLWVAIAVLAAALPSLANHAAGLGDHALALTSNAAHAGAAAVWVGTGLMVMFWYLRDASSSQEMLRRYSTLALVCWLILAASGFINGYVRLESPGQLLTTGYGQLLIGKAALLIVVGLIGWRIKLRFASAQRACALLGIDVMLLGAAVGLGVALASTPYPRLPVPFTTLAEALLGTAPPGPVTWESLILGFRFDPVFAIVVSLGVALIVRTWQVWPSPRRGLWLAGLVALLWSTNGGLAAYAPVLPAAGAVQVAMLAGPVGFLLARGWRGTWPKARWAATVWMSAALLAAAIWGGWSMGSYLTRTGLLLIVATASGYFFAQLDRTRSARFSAGIVAVVVIIAGIISTAIAPWYLLVQPEWLIDPLTDAQVGAFFAAGLVLVAMIAALVQPPSDSRASPRTGATFR
jgi:putative copper export protein